MCCRVMAAGVQWLSTAQFIAGPNSNWYEVLERLVPTEADAPFPR